MIDLMGNTTFTSHEISARVVALIRQKYTLDAEQKVSRIATGSLQGTYTPSVTEKQSITDYQAHVESCIKIGAKLAADNSLLTATIEYETAVKRIDTDPIDSAGYPDYKDDNGVLVRHPILVDDDMERVSAQGIVDAVSAEVLAMVAIRLKQREAEKAIGLAV